MARTTFSLAGSDGLELAAYRWEPDGEPRGAVVLVHGMGEHAGRAGYDRLATALAEHGYLVLAADHRGHGGTAASLEVQGDLGEDGWARLVDDLGVVVERARADAGGAPVAMIAHSMGSFAAQQWVLDHSEEIAGLALSGTAVLDLLEPALDLDSPIDLSGFNAPFAYRTGFEWLSRDEAEVDAYVADPRCGFGLDTANGKAMFLGGRALAEPDRLGGIARGLPVHLTVGEHDPVNAGLALATPLVERLQTAGLGDVTLRVWPDARHEVLNETNRAEVVADLVAFVDRVIV